MSGRQLLLTGRQWVSLFVAGLFLLWLGMRYVAHLAVLEEVASLPEAAPLLREIAQAGLLRDVVLALVAAMLLWICLDVLWLRRARRLAAAVEEIGNGRLDRRAGVAGIDELGLIGQAVDRMAERLEREQQRAELMADLIARSPAVVVEWRVGHGWPVLYISEGVSQWGYKPSDFMAEGREYLGLVHPDDLGGVLDDLEQRFHGRDEHFVQIYRLRQADGGWAWIEDRTRIERDAQGNVLRATGILLDISDRQRAERVRRERDAAFRRFFELPFMGMAISSPSDKRWLEVNGRLCQMLGYEREELLARTWPEVTHPDDMAVNTAMFEDLLAGRLDGYEMEKRFIRRDGGIVHTEMAVRGVYDADGRLQRLFTTIQDVTERKAAQEALRHSEGLLREVQRIGHIGSWEYDTAQGRLYCSEEMYRIHEMSPGGFADLPAMIELVHPQERPSLRARLETLVRSGGTLQQSYRLCLPNGRIRQVYLKAESVMEQGRVRRTIGMVQDVTEQEALRSERDRLAMVADASSDVVLMAYPAGLRVFYLNRAGRDLLGIGTEAPVEEVIGSLFPAWARRQIEDQALPAAQRTGSWRGETVVISREGREIPMSQLVIAHGDAEGGAPFFSVILRDISEHRRNLALLEAQSRQLRQAEESLREANQALEQRVVERTDQLRKANQELEAFTYSVSHDLKAPLRGIDGYSQLLQEEYASQLDEEGRLFVARIRRGVEQMGILIGDLLDYARMERRQMERQDVNVHELCERALEAFASDIERFRTRVDNRIGAGVRLSVDREGLAVTMRNLIGNAIKFSSDRTPPVVEIGASVADGRVRIWVRDNGVGFDMKYYDRIFGIFQRLHRAEDYAGTGVGLALVAKAVDRMGGRVWAESTPGQGAVFYLEFPAS